MIKNTIKKIPQPAIGIRCYVCHFSEEIGDGDNRCKDNGEDITDDFLEECGDGFDVCTFHYSCKEGTDLNIFFAIRNVRNRTLQVQDYVCQRAKKWFAYVFLN